MSRETDRHTAGTPKAPIYLTLRFHYNKDLVGLRGVKERSMEQQTDMELLNKYKRKILEIYVLLVLEQIMM